MKFTLCITSGAIGLTFSTMWAGQCQTWLYKKILTRVHPSKSSTHTILLAFLYCRLNSVGYNAVKNVPVGSHIQVLTTHSVVQFSVLWDLMVGSHAVEGK
jgi:hypothetical protein